jgi:hypothetical protein
MSRFVPTSHNSCLIGITHLNEETGDCSPPRPKCPPAPINPHPQPPSTEIATEEKVTSHARKAMSARQKYREGATVCFHLVPVIDDEGFVVTEAGR